MRSCRRISDPAGSVAEPFFVFVRIDALFISTPFAGTFCPYTSGSFVAYQIPCPQCDRTGFVRLEHVIKGRSESVAYYCGSCEHNWIIAATTNPLPPTPTRPPLPKPRTRFLRRSYRAVRRNPD